jgi:hypothetical protein
MVGKSLGYMANETDPRGILSAIHGSMIYGSRIGLLPELHPWLALMARTLGLKIPLDSVGEFIEEKIADRKSGKAVGNKNDFLAKLIVLEDAARSTVTICPPPSAPVSLQARIRRPSPSARSFIIY